VLSHTFLIYSFGLNILSFCCHHLGKFICFLRYIMET
jgi:hypothetical protein